jgi:ribosomal protein L39E
MMTSAALVGIDSCPIEGFHQEKQRLYYESSTWIQRNTVCPSWSHLDTEKQIQQTKSRRKIEDIVTWK